MHARTILAAEKERYFSNIIASLENQNLTSEPFYHQDRITDWYKAGSTKHLIEANEKKLQQMRKELTDNKCQIYTLKGAIKHLFVIS